MARLCSGWNRSAMSNTTARFPVGRKMHQYPRKPRSSRSRRSSLRPRVASRAPPDPREHFSNGSHDQVYTARRVETNVLLTVGPRVPAPVSDAARAKAVTEELGTVAPKFVQLTNHVIFDDLWRRSDLSPRDRSLITIAALAAMGDDDQLDFYLRRGVDSGLTRAQITEALTHLGFYAGWMKATTAMMAVTRTLGKQR